MNKKCFLLVVTLVTLCITSCSNIQSRHQISKLESLTEKVEKKGGKFSQQDWQDVLVEYKQISSEMINHSYTNEQLEEIGAIKARFYVACARQKLKSASGLLNGIMHQAVGALDELMVSLEDETSTANLPAEDTDDAVLKELENMFD